MRMQCGTSEASAHGEEAVRRPPLEADDLTMRRPLDLAARRRMEVVAHPVVNHRIRDQTMIDDDRREDDKGH